MSELGSKRPNSDTLTIDGVSKRYGGVVALNGVSFEVRAGEVLGLLGPNGAGKTTLVDMITGVQEVDSGTITLGGTELKGNASRRAPLGISRTFQHPQLAEGLTALENILLGRYASRLRGLRAMTARAALEMVTAGSRASDEEACREIIDTLGINSPDQLAGDLTLGEQRLVEVARALAADPKLLLLDEPFAGSDAGSMEAIQRAIGTAGEQGKIVLLIDHNVDLVAAIVERVVVMALGQVVFDGDTAAGLASPETRRVYFGDSSDEHEKTEW